MNTITHPAARLVAALLAAWALLAPAAGSAGTAGILNSKHNLSVSGPGTVKATSEERVCVFCHTPHHANPSTPLWSRSTSTAIYDLYESTTLVAKPGQPSGSARLCLSCHDGTIALGALYGTDRNRNTIDMAGGIVKLPAGRPSNLGGSSGKDLADDHPVSFAYTDSLSQLNGKLTPPASLPHKIRLEEGNMLQCIACHNPHTDPFGKFLVVDNSSSGLCKACHSIGELAASSHGTAPGMGAGCTLCHASHNAGGRMRLLRFAAEEQNCYQCHSNLGGAKDIKTPAAKFYRHPVEATTGIHDPKENLLAAEKHVECEDCHNSHRAQAAAALAPAASGPLYGVRGVSGAGDQLATASYQYEICFRCHADNSYYGSQTVVRQVQELNTRLDFDPTNPSFHPVLSIGKGSRVPSLRTLLSTSSMIYCTDCHSNDDPSQARGPHGSSYKHILVARYETDSYPLSYSEANYALCFRCHDPLVLLDPVKSAFPLHQQHVVTGRTPCSVCHDPHGVPRLRGASSTANAHLINFDLRFAGIGASYDSLARSCSVSCHGGTPRSY